MRVFVGSWKGTGGGEPGIGDYSRSYRFVLNDNQIRETFELAEPDKPFSVYTRVTLNRVE